MDESEKEVESDFMQFLQGDDDLHELKLFNKSEEIKSEFKNRFTSTLTLKKRSNLDLIEIN